MIAIADGVAPFVIGNIVPAGKSVDAGLKLLQSFDHFGAEALDVVSGHQ